MKSVVSENPCEKEIEYPCLMKNTDNGRIVLFVAPKKGTCLTLSETRDISYKIGDFNDSFAMSSYKPFHGSVCLEN